MVKVTPTQLREYRKQWLNKPCPICGTPMLELKNIVADHDHHTGEVRGAICRNCNGLLGKVENAANRGKRKLTLDMWLDNAIAWRRKNHTGWLYPTHKSEAEKKAAAAKRRKAAAAKRVAQLMKDK